MFRQIDIYVMSGIDSNGSELDAGGKSVLLFLIPL